MKRNVLVIAGLAVLSTSAYAYKARVQALGQDEVRGSEYISDTRNVFRNPAGLNETKNYLVTEWGTSAANDTAVAPRAEGGFFREAGAFNYGLYLGNNENNAARTAGFLTQDNALDLFLSGDMGVKWGARLHYASATDEATTTWERKNTALGLGLGVVAGAAEGYLNVDLSDKSEGDTTAASNEYKVKPGFLVGGSYTMEKMTAFASYENTKVESKVGATTSSTKGSEITVGAGHTMDINPTARVYTDAKIVLGTEKTAAGKTKENSLPVTIGVESDATSWLTLRGSVSQNVILNNTKSVTGKKASQPNTTTVNAGATLNFGKLKVDGLIGTTDAARNGTVAGSNTNKGVLSTDNLMSRVAVSYWF